MKKETKYLITQDQLHAINYSKDMFELNAKSINSLCSSEKEDIVYGFELGQRYTHLMDCFIEMMELVSAIEKQKFVEKEAEADSIDPVKQSIEFTDKNLRAVNTLLSEDYKIGFREGVEKYIAYLNRINS